MVNSFKLPLYLLFITKLTSHFIAIFFLDDGWSVYSKYWTFQILTQFIPKKITTMVENVDDEVDYDGKPCENYKDDRILVNSLIK